MKHNLIIGQRYIYDPYKGQVNPPRFIGEITDVRGDVLVLQVLDGQYNITPIGQVITYSNIISTPKWWRLLSNQSSPKR